MKNKLRSLFKTSYLEIVLIIFTFSFSVFLMFFTFHKEDGTLFIASKAWSDFGSHLPLIRSFSFGSNFPPEYPLFPGQPINYHFLFYFLVGLIEKAGIPIDYALNIPSTIGLSGLILSIYFVAKKIFQSRAVGFLSVIFFLFNSSFSFIYFLQNHKNSPNLILDLVTNDKFSSFAPYGQGLVTAFWNLNIYTNQRHLALSFTLSLLIIFLIIYPSLSNKKINLKLSYFLGVILGLSFYLHIAVFFITLIVLFFLFIVFPNLRKSIFILGIPAFLISFPQYLYLQSGEGGFGIKFVNGYLTASESSLSFVKFWVYNLGISAVLIPLGFIKSSKTARKILFCFIPLFLIGNFVQFSPEVAANHKFFNYFLLVGNMFSAFFLVFLWKKNLFLKSVSVFLFLLMILGGIVDFFPIFNDNRGALADYEKNKDVSWIKENTLPDSVFLNTTYFYNPASLAGRKIFFGWPYFAWSAGYDTHKRGQMRDRIIQAPTKNLACRLLSENGIDYVEFNSTSPENDIPKLSAVYSKEFIPIYRTGSGYKVYSVEKNCK
ncbi:MAG: hypothetical protein A2186_01415 [Candidatus Levybacteria bacterium RIFOXYA1_FULL_41_10]|nr:MAG: hypothetical protein UU15_C0006G0005 [Candidatus Levybacteria bacterium GW2011_GWC2_40_7]KKR95468.1 MAG: hypothetical protein UU45_C0001G0063 [Candidatus Levybacteria bacterium GW2011_GWA2_41_15]OGH24637.1 MAG: hypothetical protein A3D82_01165 [Candidatus Levybacteria bacterium RIFCSPHIGHO2_02_FULL_40_29]OGH50793.1 MAG: hypothetical protein A3J18_01365 [Candidatus Levybacteria bacterium RIFCSPLOWO2_02_FULL_40_18]OGH52419.1 MAG: hypothetical protein A3H20_00960 [Candidatus Levybacteria b